MQFRSLSAQTRADTGMNYRLDFDYTDIPAGVANNTAVVFNTAALKMPYIPNQLIHRRCQLHLTTPFQDISDAALNTTTCSVGDSVSATHYISAVELNLNGTEVLNTYPGAVENYKYVAADRLVITLGSMAAKSVSNIDKGKAYILFGWDEPDAQLREDIR